MTRLHAVLNEVTGSSESLDIDRRAAAPPRPSGAAWIGSL